MPITFKTTAGAVKQRVAGDEIFEGDGTDADSKLQKKSDLDARLQPIGGTHQRSPLPIRVGSDLEADQLVERAEAETIAETKILENVPTHTVQFSTNTGVARLDSIFLPVTSSNVSLNFNGHYASIFTANQPTKPIYHFLGVDKTGARHGNRAIVEHCSLLVPNILVANRPTSPLATYASQAAMLADQANQVTNSHYYYTGSTSAWRKTAASTGVIGDYVEVPEIAGWQTWGTRPAWLIVQGDAYLTGVDNLNFLDFTYHRFITISSVDYTDVVVCTIKAITNGNYDTSKPNLNLAVHHRYNENPATVAVDSIINFAPYGSEFATEILKPQGAGATPAPATYESLGGGNFALVQGIESTSRANNSELLLQVTNTYNRLAVSQKVTLIFRISFPDLFTATTFGLWDSRTIADRTGFLVDYTVSTGVIRIAWTGTDGSTRSLSSPSSSVTRGTHYWKFAIVFEKTSTTSFACRMYRQCEALSIAFAEILNTTNTNALNTDASLITNLSEINFDAGSLRPKKRDEFKLIFNALTSSQVQAEFDLMPSL